MKEDTKEDIIEKERIMDEEIEIDKIFSGGNDEKPKKI